MGLPAFGYDISPSAWSFSKLYEFANVSHQDREKAISELRAKIEAKFPIIIFAETDVPLEEVEERIIRIGESISDPAKILCNALVVLLDTFNNRISGDLVQSKFFDLAELVRNLPYSPASIKADLQDARNMPLEDKFVDFVITSPPYINVFNYHQNYRRSVEMLGWDVLRVARSEIGSNRANRGNRFLTVVQYCIDMAGVLQEVARVLKPGGRAVFIVGYESRVLGVPFYNADLVERLAANLGLFDLTLRQKRVFQNRFGQDIREDILNLTRKSVDSGYDQVHHVGRRVASAALEAAIAIVSPKNRTLVTQALSSATNTDGTPVFAGDSHIAYHTREYVMMIKEEEETFIP